MNHPTEEQQAKSELGVQILFVKNDAETIRKITEAYERLAEIRRQYQLEQYQGWLERTHGPKQAA
jgi:hypothetical protein